MNEHDPAGSTRRPRARGQRPARARDLGRATRGRGSTGGSAHRRTGLTVTDDVDRLPCTGPRGTAPSRRLILLVVCLLALAVVASAAALFRSAPDARWYYAANTGVLLRLQPFPDARQVALKSFRHADPRSDAPVFKVTWYTTRAAYVVPARHLSGGRS